MPLNRFKDNKLKEYFKYISEVNREAYRDIYLLSNQVLSKDPFSNALFDDYLEGKDIEDIPFHKVFLNN